MALTEIAPGVDLERDILANMAFRPLIGELREMDARLFASEPMGLRTELLRLDIPESMRSRIELQAMGDTWGVMPRKWKNYAAADLVPADIDDASLEAAARAEEKVTEALAGKPVKKVIVKSGRLVNLVV